MKKFILFSIILGALSSTVISCGSPPAKEAASKKDDKVDGSGEDSALFVGVSTTWVGTSEVQNHGSCIVSTMVQPETSTTCKVRIPEGQLYYSKLSITLGTNVATLCPVVRFAPYYYQRADDDTYVPPGEKDPIKCGSELSTTAKCWGGAATQMVQGFPKYKGTFQVSAFTPSYTYNSPSDTETLWYGGRSNRGVVNNLPSASRGADQAGYIGGSMVDYKIVCEDMWAHPIYTVTLTIQDDDTLNTENDTPKDEIPDWQ